MIVRALVNRAVYALIALDEMGIQYYLEANRDTRADTLYHFGYFVTLATGILDNLALETDARLGIGFKERARMSLSKKAGKEFLKEIGKRRPDIKKHISNNVYLIKALYSFREPVVHRMGLPNIGFQQKGDISWKANLVSLSPGEKEMIKLCGDMKSDFDPFTQWGVCEVGTGQYILPYIFATRVMMKLVPFVNQYLELLGYRARSPKDMKAVDAAVLKDFEAFHLGF